MTYHVTVLWRAEKDTDQIYLWIAKRSGQGAGQWYRAFLDAVDSLKLNADRFGLAPEALAAGADVRQHFFKTRKGRTYRLLYLIVGQEARILRVRGPGQPTVEVGEIFS